MLMLLSQFEKMWRAAPSCTASCSPQRDCAPFVKVLNIPYQMNTVKNQHYHASVNSVKEIILDVLKNEDVRIILFGSAARGDAHRYSDIDVGILPKNGYKKEKLILLKEKFENMNIPYHVELVDLSLVSAIFKENVLKEGQVWKN